VILEKCEAIGCVQADSVERGTHTLAEM